MDRKSNIREVYLARFISPLNAAEMFAIDLMKKNESLDKRQSFIMARNLFILDLTDSNFLRKRLDLDDEL